MFAFGEVDRDQFIWDIFLLADKSDEARAGGRGETVQLEHLGAGDMGMVLRCLDDGSWWKSSPFILWGVTVDRFRGRISYY